jgi:hypothetical protein
VEIQQMDDVAREYLLIGLSLGELEDGVVDSYFGPPDVKQQALTDKAAPSELVARSAALRARLDEVADAQRARWLDRQLIATETIARQINGEDVPYLELVERCFDATPQPTPPEEYATAREELERLLPGQGDLRDRLEAHQNTLTVPADKLADVVDWVTGELRAAAQASFFVPPGEDLEISLVTDEPWGAYNWYDGNLHSRIEVNTDLPVRATSLMGLLAHEAFPGHHLEHSTKEQRLVRDQGRYESSVQLINTPEAYISEGLAETGVRFVAGEQRWKEMLIGVCERAGIAMSDDEADRNWRLGKAYERLGGASGDAALLLHVDGKSPEDVIRFFELNALATRERAEKSLEFINHPLWRAYVFCYAGGERLLTDWVTQAGSPEGEIQRFSRLLSEQLTPSGIVSQMAPTS